MATNALLILQSISGIGPVWAAGIIAEIGSITAFHSSDAQAPRFLFSRISFWSLIGNLIFPSCHLRPTVNRRATTQRKISSTNVLSELDLQKLKIFVDYFNLRKSTHPHTIPFNSTVYSVSLRLSRRPVLEYLS